MNGATENYTYDAAGNLDVKAGMDLNYNDATHEHAVTHIGGVQKYWYDANGNQTKRIVGADTYDLAYDAENRMIEVKKNNTVMATFVYDGDGRRVKSTINGTMTTFAGSHYEVTGGSVTKYYFAGASRIAMRKDGNLTYLLSDHLGSTSITTDANGNSIFEQRYKPWGETRYTTLNATASTKYQFTGQYSHETDFGLLFYKARWMDPQLGRFVQADSIVPGGVQGLDRYAYVNNSPVVYVDPSGHEPHGPGSCYGAGDINCEINNEKHKQDILYSKIIKGSRDDGSWTEGDWKKYLKNRDKYWNEPDKWPYADPYNWESFALHAQRLASQYDLSYSAQRKQFVRDFALLFAGISSLDGWMEVAIDSAYGPEIEPILNEGTEGLSTQYQDSNTGNQSHHYAGVFFSSYFAEPIPALIANIPRDLFDRGGPNFGDLTLDFQATFDANEFKYNPGSNANSIANFILNLMGP